MRSNPNPLHLIQRDLIPSPIVELGRPRRLMSRERLAVLDRPAILQIRRYFSRLEGVSATKGVGRPVRLGRHGPSL